MAGDALPNLVMAQGRVTSLLLALIASSVATASSSVSRTDSPPSWSIASSRPTWAREGMATHSGRLATGALRARLGVQWNEKISMATST